MSYIITARFYEECEKVSVNAVAKLLNETKIHLLSKRDGLATVDIAGDHLETAERTLFLCQKLIANGIYEFSIRHSY